MAGHAGYLSKKGGFRSNWLKRWFAIEGAAHAKCRPLPLIMHPSKTLHALYSARKLEIPARRE